MSEFSDLIAKGIPSLKGFHHKGEWAIHEALNELLMVTGPAFVMMETFNISEDALRPLLLNVESGLIEDLKLVLDLNIKRHKLDILLFANSITNHVHLSACHAKVLLIENERYHIGIVGSANANQPIRYEAGFLFSDKKTFDFFRSSFEELYDNDSIPFVCS